MKFDFLEFSIRKKVRRCTMDRKMTPFLIEYDLFRHFGSQKSGYGWWFCGYFNMLKHSSGGLGGWWGGGCGGGLGCFIFEIFTGYPIFWLPKGLNRSYLMRNGVIFRSMVQRLTFFLIENSRKSNFKNQFLWSKKIF